MNRFDWFKAIGFGVLIWAVGGAVLWALTASTLSAGWVHGIVAAVIGIAAYLFAINARPGNIVHALGYGTVFAAVGIALDAVVTRVFDAHTFTIWQYYLGYGLALFAPLFRMELPTSARILSAR